SGPVKSSPMWPSTAARAKNRGAQSSLPSSSNSSVVSGAAGIVMSSCLCGGSPPAHGAAGGHDLRSGFGDQHCLFESNGTDARLRHVLLHGERHSGEQYCLVIGGERRRLPADSDAVTRGFEVVGGQDARFGIRVGVMGE